MLFLEFLMFCTSTLVLFQVTSSLCPQPILSDTYNGLSKVESLNSKIQSWYIGTCNVLIFQNLIFYICHLETMRLTFKYMINLSESIKNLYDFKTISDCPQMCTIINDNAKRRKINLPLGRQAHSQAERYGGDDKQPDSIKKFLILTIYMYGQN